MVCFTIYSAKLLPDYFQWLKCYFCMYSRVFGFWSNTCQIDKEYAVIYLCDRVYILHSEHYIGTKWTRILKEFLHKTLAFPLLFEMFSHTRKKKCGQFPIKLHHKRGLTNKSLCQCPFFSSQRPKAHLHEKKPPQRI